MSFVDHFKRKDSDQELDQALKWYFEKDMENEKPELTSNKGFTPMIDLTNDLLKSTSFAKNKSYGLYRQLTIDTAKNKIIRSSTAATLKSKESDLVEVIDEKGKILKINRDLVKMVVESEGKNKSKF